MSLPLQQNLIELRFIVSEPRKLIKDLIHDPFFMLDSYEEIIEEDALIAKNSSIKRNSMTLFKGDVYFFREPGSLTYVFEDYRGFIFKILIRFENFFVDNYVVRIRIYPGSNGRVVYYEDLKILAEYFRENFVEYFSEKYILKPI
ncbi:MAG: hypothetical protein ACP5I7_07485 [Sulfolobales archaeon]